MSINNLTILTNNIHTLGELLPELKDISLWKIHLGPTVWSLTEEDIPYISTEWLEKEFKVFHVGIMDGKYFAEIWMRE